MENVKFLLKKQGEFSMKIAKKKIMKIAKKKLDTRLFLYSLSQYLHQQKFFGVLLLYWMLNADIFIHLCSTKIMLFDGDFRIMRILYLMEADVRHLKTESQQHNFTFSISPQVKTADFKIPEHIFSMMTLTMLVTSTLQAMKQ